MNLRPRRIDYAMWVLVGLSMVATALALLDTRNVASWMFGIGWIALGAFLIRWRWSALRLDTEAWKGRSAGADDLKRP